MSQPAYNSPASFCGEWSLDGFRCRVYHARGTDLREDCARGNTVGDGLKRLRLKHTPALHAFVVEHAMPTWMLQMDDKIASGPIRLATNQLGEFMATLWKVVPE